jgi:hypothetical protein
MATPEGIVKKQILDYLKARGIFHWVNQAGRIPGRKLLKTGIADILGVFRGRMLAIEVKAPGEKPSDKQEEFIADVNRHGGIAFVAKSVDDVEHEFELAEKL